MDEADRRSLQDGESTEPSVRVLIADDRRRSRDGLRALLSTLPEIEVIGEAADGQEVLRLVEEHCPPGSRAPTPPKIEVTGEAADGREAMRLAGEHCPDVVLMDAKMPVVDGIEATRIIKQRWPEVRIIVLTMHSSYRATALDAGADAFLVKGCPANELLEAILER
jgi:DNA-binding NarL/FixJ family response regulator